MRAGTAAARDANGIDLAALRNTFTASAPTPPAGLRLNISDLTYSLKSLMWRQMGVVRDAQGLEDALAKIAFWTRAVRDLAQSEPQAWELMNMLTVARLATLSAARREESRGVHYRSDFKKSSDDWKTHTVIVPRFEGETPRSVEICSEPVGDRRAGEQIAV
jgi:L-aspartate oxidase